MPVSHHTTMYQQRILEICSLRFVHGQWECLVHYANSWLPEVDVDEIIHDDYSEPISQVLDRRVAQGSRFTFIEMLVSWRNVWLPVRGLDLTCSILQQQVEQLLALQTWTNSSRRSSRIKTINQAIAKKR